MGARTSRNRSQQHFKDTATPDIKHSKSNFDEVPVGSGADCNGNHLVLQNSKDKNIVSEEKNCKSKSHFELPLADKSISVERAQQMLANSKSQALSELNSAGFIPALDELSSFAFPFENAVFEGGGVKGIAYIGALKCLEDVGIKMTRFAGASIGASVAGFLSVGYTADEVVALYLQDLSIFIHDSRCEFLCFLPRLTGNFGLNPGKKFYDWYGRCLAVKTKNPDITFRQVYQQFDTELCVIVLNMNTGREEYCHPKTTPDLSVRKAIRMSISVPGVLQPEQMFHVGGNSSMYVDGGIICNYPIYVFDGWWLSMKAKHSIYNTIHRLPSQGVTASRDPIAMLCDSNSRFCKRNNKTLGFAQTEYSGFFNDRYTHDSSHAKHSFSRPQTKLSRRRKKRLISMEKSKELQTLQRVALLKLFEVLYDCSNEEGFVIRDRLILALSQNLLADSELSILFGKDFSLNKLLDNMPGATTDGSDGSNALISPTELDDYFIRHGLDMHRALEATMVVTGHIPNLTSFFIKLQRHVTNAARRTFIKHEDISRTVNIHTDYIEFLDFEIGNEDKVFLMQQGYKYTLVYLQEYMLKQKKLQESGAPPLDVYVDIDKHEVTSNANDNSMFYADDEDSYNKWLCSLPSDNISLKNNKIM